MGNVGMVAFFLRSPIVRESFCLVQECIEKPDPYSRKQCARQEWGNPRLRRRLGDARWQESAS